MSRAEARGRWVGKTRVVLLISAPPRRISLRSVREDHRPTGGGGKAEKEGAIAAGQGPSGRQVSRTCRERIVVREVIEQLLAHGVERCAIENVWLVVATVTKFSRVPRLAVVNGPEVDRRAVTIPATGLRPTHQAASDVLILTRRIDGNYVDKNGFLWSEAEVDITHDPSLSLVDVGLAMRIGSHLVEKVAPRELVNALLPADRLWLGLICILQLANTPRGEQTVVSPHISSNFGVF